jgi:molybdopterin synthase catalytic subunit
MERNYIINGPISENVINRVLKNMEGDTSNGGHSCFLGQVRADKINGKQVTAIEYSVYEIMIENEIEKIKSGIKKQFRDVRNIEIFHSSGLVKAGEISLLIMVSARHRQQAIAACNETLELVKEKLPVWKKEIFDDDTHDWK